MGHVHLSRLLATVLVLSVPAESLHIIHTSSSFTSPTCPQTLYLRGGTKANSGLSGFAAGDALKAEMKLPMKVQDWTVGDVETWLKASGMQDVAIIFHKHQIDGTTLLELNEERIQRLGIELVSRQIKAASAVHHLQKSSLMPGRLQIHVPLRIDNWMRFLTCRFLHTREGKEGSRCQMELVQSHIAMALTSALMFGAAVRCSTSSTGAAFELRGTPLSAFFSLSTTASVIFLFCTMSSILQVLIIQQCSDDKEVLVFLDKLGCDESLCFKLLLSGMSSTALAVLVYMIFAEKLGLVHNSKSWWGWGSVVACIAVSVSVIPKWMSMVQKLYVSKLYTAYHPEKKAYDIVTEHSKLNMIPSIKLIHLEQLREPSIPRTAPKTENAIRMPADE